MKSKIKLVCEDCGKQFERYPSQVGRFCSRSCSGRYATVVKAEKVAATFREDFWRRASIIGECWEWQGSRTSANYGNLKTLGIVRQAHVVAWELTRGPVPEGMEVCHICDNRPCIRWDHLFVGTRQDNMDDMVTKGRSPDNEKENNPNVKIGQIDVDRIRELRGHYTQAELAIKFDISQPHVSRIMRGESWRP